MLWIGRPNSPYNNTVVPGKDGKLIKSSDQIPPGSNVAGYEYAKGQDGKWVHEAALLLTMSVWAVAIGALASEIRAQSTRSGQHVGSLQFCLCTERSREEIEIRLW